MPYRDALYPRSRGYTGGIAVEDKAKNLQKVSEGATSCTSQPVAWAALNDDGEVAWIGYTQDGAADGAGGRQVVPLYRHAMGLTDAEREAIRQAADAYEENDMDAVCGDIAATLRGLLERSENAR